METLSSLHCVFVGRSLCLCLFFILLYFTHTHTLCVFLYSMFSILYTGIPFLFETIFVLFRSESPFSFKHFLHSRNSLPFENIPYSILFSFFRVWGFVEAKILSLFSLALARIHSTGWNPKVHYNDDRPENTDVITEWKSGRTIVTKTFAKILKTVAEAAHQPFPFIHVLYY